ncbi:nucleoside hydrolase [Pelagicoccus mobilis]
MSEASNKVKVILDTDMGSDCDDVGALALLHSYALDGKAEILGVIYSSGVIPYGVGVIDAINTCFGKPDLPIGAYKKTDVGDPIDKMLAEKLAKDTAAFGHKRIGTDDAEDQTKLNRRLLANAEDSSVMYVTIGHTTGISELLSSGADEVSSLNGIELVRKKVRRWVALGGLRANSDNGYHAQDWNFFRNGTVPYTKHAIDTCPVPITFINAGDFVLTGKSLIKTSPGNIVRTAYRDWLWEFDKSTLEAQRPSWDLATVYYTVEGLGPYLEEDQPGHLDFDVEKGSRWFTETVNELHTYVNQVEGRDEAFAKYLDALMSKHLPKNSD